MADMGTRRGGGKNGRSPSWKKRPPEREKRPTTWRNLFYFPWGGASAYSCPPPADAQGRGSYFIDIFVAALVQPRTLSACARCAMMAGI